MARRRVARRLRYFATLVLASVCVLDCSRQKRAVEGARPEPDETLEWLQLFNGRDLHDWVPKFSGYPLGHNLNETFRADSGMLMVRYDRWRGKPFEGEFGHLFYRLRPFSHYVIAVEYRFVGRQVATSGRDLGWADRNSGVMIHSEPPDSMALDQDFPQSLEVQLLGGLSDGQERPTANLCTTGAQVMVGERIITRHCIRSSARTYHGDGWIRVEAIVLGDSLLRHIVNGDTVLTYSEAQTVADSANVIAAQGQSGKPPAGGYIAIQAETAPLDIRKVELLNLAGCKDPKAVTYKRYFVQADSNACFYTKQPARP